MWAHLHQITTSWALRGPTHKENPLVPATHATLTFREHRKSWRNATIQSKDEACDTNWKSLMDHLEHPKAAPSIAIDLECSHFRFPSIMDGDMGGQTAAYVSPKQSTRRCQCAIPIIWNADNIARVSLNANKMSLEGLLMRPWAVLVRWGTMDHKEGCQGRDKLEHSRDFQR